VVAGVVTKQAAYLEEVQVATQRRAGCLVVVSDLADDDKNQTDGRGNGQSHGRDDTRKAPEFAHAGGWGWSAEIRNAAEVDVRRGLLERKR
jgi:hypothetical protein